MYNADDSNYNGKVRKGTNNDGRNELQACKTACGCVLPAQRPRRSNATGLYRGLLVGVALYMKFHFLWRACLMDRCKLAIFTDA